MKIHISLSSFDMYSKKICFYYNNQEKISSYFGFILTLVYILASVILFILEIIKAFKRAELKVSDTTIYSKEMPIIDVDMDKLYFAFGLEYPNSANRYIDEQIYTAKITFFDKQKIKGKFETIVQKDLEFEKCNVDNFGKDYQNLFTKDELNNSYCLKNFNYTLTFAGSYKYDRITYIRIVINPCVNSTKNNFSCKPQEVIDEQINSGYFSIVLKDFGLNPSNYTSPKIPTLQDLYTTIDRRLSKNYIVNFGLTEIHTDKGIVNNQINKERYLQFRKVFENFSIRKEKDFHSGKSVILVQLRLEDTLLIQKRSYTKITEVFSRIGGYMQLMNTVFLLATSIINRIYSEIKIINGIFNFNIKENKMILKLKSLKNPTPIINFSKNNKKKNFFSSNIINNLSQFENQNRSNNNLIIKENSSNNNITFLNEYDKKKKNYSIKLNNNNKNFITFDNSKNESFKSRNNNNNDSKIERYSKYLNRDNIKNIFFSFSNNSKKDLNILDYNDDINLTILDYFCSGKKSKKNKYIQLFNKGNAFYRKKMDIVNVFTLLTILEDFIKRKV